MLGRGVQRRFVAALGLAISVSIISFSSGCSQLVENEAQVQLSDEDTPEGPLTLVDGTTATCIDRDSDRYGVGPGCSGPDADDKDPAVQTAAHVKTKYPGGTVASDGLSVFLNAVKGYRPSHYYYVSPSGNNDTGVVDDPSHPFATISGIRSVHALSADDIVLIRGGTYTDNWRLAYPTTSGALGHPVIFMAYPGERPIWDLIADWGGEPTQGNNHLVFDGLNFTNSATGLGRTYSFGGDGGAGCTGITIRNSEVWNRANGVFAMQGLKDWIIENNVFHDTVGSHGVYLGSRNHPNSNLILRRNLIYRVGLTCAQHNGRVTNYLVDSNICYAFSNATGFSLEMGVTNSRMVNNVCFNGERSCLTIYNYPSPPSMPDIRPYDQTGNVIENNTFVQGTLKWQNGAPLVSGSPAISFGLFTPDQTEDIWHNTIRNNIFVTRNGIAPVFVMTGRSTYNCYVAGSCTGADYKVNGVDPRELAKLITFQNNLIFNSAGTQIFRITNVHGPANAGAAPGSIPASVNTLLDWTQFRAYSESYFGNLNVDPQFVADDVSFATTPLSYNYALQPSSPAKGVGLATGELREDVRGAVRGSPPSVGAYD